MKKNLMIFLLTLLFCLNVYATDPNKYERIANRIASRALIIKERIESIHTDNSTRTPDLYYFIIGILEDSNGLFQLGDFNNARQKLVAIDTITYDVVCAGISPAVELNRSTGNFQKTKNAANLAEFKKTVESCMGIVDRSGLLQSVRFTQSEEKIFSAIATAIHNQSSSISENIEGSQIKEMMCSTDLIDSKDIFFKLPATADPTFIKFIFGFEIDKQWGLTPKIYINGEKISKSMFLMILFNIYAYHEGLGVHNNDSLESQIHYLLSQMRIADFLTKNKIILEITNTQDIEDYMQMCKSSYERLVEESLQPDYYDRILEIKEFAGTLNKVNFNWTKPDNREHTDNLSSADDYLFYIAGNGSQMPPNPRLVEFIEKQLPENFPFGTAFDIGSGDGRNSLYFAKNKKLFHRVVAVDHSQAAVNRIKRLPLLESDILEIMAVQANIIDYKFPSDESPVYQRPNIVLMDNVAEFLPDKDRIVLFAEIGKSLLPSGIIFIEYHLASGPKFEKLKKSKSHSLTGTTVSPLNEFEKKQKKHFYQKGEMEIELAKAGISSENGFTINSRYSSGDDFDFGIVIIKKTVSKKN